MGNQSIISIEAVIDYIESHLDGKLELETVAEAVHYSKYHLHRLFTETVGMTIHDYVQRRQLTEAAKLLVFSDKPIIEIAFICGYESQQSFSLAFKAMYKSPPAEYREERSFYPLQLRFILHRRTTAMEFTIQDIRLAEKKDIVDWMNLMRLVIDGYPVMDEDDYLAKLEESIDEKRALVLREGDILIGAMAFTYSPGSIEFLGVHPQYRNRGLQKVFLDALLEIYLPGQEISTTTFREQDKADTGHRDMLLQLGFAEKELLTEFGYPTQRFVLPPKKQEAIQHGCHATHRLAEKNTPFLNQSMYHTLWLYACSNGARLVCNHADIQRRVGGCIYSLFLSAAISHFIYRRRMGRPIPQKKIDYRRRSADCICHFRNGIGNSAYFIGACFAWRFACYVGHTILGGRNTNSSGQCHYPTACPGRSAYAVQRH